MKKNKIILLNVIAASIIFSSCSEKNKEIKLIDKNFKCNAEIDYEDKSYIADIERVDEVGWNILINSPKTINGMNISYLDEKCTINFEEMNIVSDYDEVPQSGIFKIITKALDMCIDDKNITTDIDNNKVIYRGEFENINFNVEAEQEEICSVKFSNGLNVEFSNYDKK